MNRFESQISGPQIQNSRTTRSLPYPEQPRTELTELYKFSLNEPTNAAQGQDGPVMKINDVQGWIRGKLMNTTGNLGREPRTIYGYRNIPYAKSFETLSIVPQFGRVKRFQV